MCILVNVNHIRELQRKNGDVKYIENVEKIRGRLINVYV